MSYEDLMQVEVTTETLLERVNARKRRLQELMAEAEKIRAEMVRDLEIVQQQQRAAERPQ